MKESTAKQLNNVKSIVPMKVTNEQIRMTWGLDEDSEPSAMDNCTMSIENNILTITVDLSKNYGDSGSKKSIIIASTGGNKNLPMTTAKVGLNIYKPVKK